jgi:DNA polymerase III subunit gamma/tau
MASYQSLYRRYRSQRFDEVLGQDHVTKALRNAVRDGRVGHAYLFSGPRGTGKTSTARILAKVLNCAAPEDGEPCGKCENCVAVAEGRVVDWLLEQDAASKSKVDDMRDLLERVPLGTSGNRKVIILDEVHMLSQGAENALLKTLEEPPAHVVFVLATTDPQKVRPTIRSRTQHFDFHLLPPDMLAEHVRHIIADAGLGIAADEVEAAVDHVVRRGQGSARDTLSALDQVAALGEVIDEGQPVDAVIDAVCERDAGRVLLAVADALAAGRDPRALGEDLISALRDAFLSLMGAADEHLAPAERERAGRVAAALGAPGLTRALDILGEALTELSRKPDPRIVVEVALVRITQPSADRTLDAILERLDRLERGAAPTGTPPAATGPAEHGAAAARDALSTARQADEPAAGPAGSRQPTLGAVSRQRGAGNKASSGDGPGSGDAGAGNGTAEAETSGGGSLAADEGGRGRGGGAGRSEVPEAGRSQRERSGRGGGAVPPEGPEGGRSRGGQPKGGSRGGSRGGDEGPGGSEGPPSQARGGGRAASPAGGDAGAPPKGGGGTAGATAGAGTLPTPDEVDAAWRGSVLAGLPVKIRSKWRGGRWIEPGDGAIRFAVPNEWHQKACAESRRDVEQALTAQLGAPVTVAVVVDGGAANAGGAGAGAGGGGPGSAGGFDPTGGPPPPGMGPQPGELEEEVIDPSELRDADDVATNGVDMLIRQFGGGQLVEEEP